MSSLIFRAQGTEGNPLDVLEEIANTNDWLFDRSSKEEMLVEVTGRWCTYRLYFFWQEDMGAIQFSCQFDMKIPASKKQFVCELLAIVNERLWLGHFDLESSASIPLFRHTSLFLGSKRCSVQELEELTEIALTECERYYPAFQFVVWGGKTPQEAVNAAILDTIAEA